MDARAVHRVCLGRFTRNLGARPAKDGRGVAVAIFPAIEKVRNAMDNRQFKRGDCSGSFGHTDRHPSIETRSIVMSAFALGASSVMGASRARLQHRRPQAVAKPRASIIAASKKKVFIDGEAGTTGLQVRDRLAGRDDIEIISLTGDDRKDPVKRAEFLNAADAAILCLPDDAAIEAVAMCTDPDTVIIDASTAHRVADGWAYGFPELNAEQKAKVASSKRIANPGCYPTGMIALTRPLVDAGFLPSGTGLVVHAVSGYSGGGKQLMAIHQAGEAEPWGAYGESRHRRVKSSSSQIIVPIPTVSYLKKNENRSTRTGAGD